MCTYYIYDCFQRHPSSVFNFLSPLLPSPSKECKQSRYSYVLPRVVLDLMVPKSATHLCSKMSDLLLFIDVRGSGMGLQLLQDNSSDSSSDSSNISTVRT